MIDMRHVLDAMPRFEKFCSVESIGRWVERARRDTAGFQVDVAGTSVGGVPIHHVRSGHGALKALFVGFPHCDEPIGGLTVSALLQLLLQRHPALCNADVEWHIVPCIDPDGARLNEGWTQQPFTLASYMHHFHKQELRDQVECSFPIQYKKLVFDSPVPEARVLQGILDTVRPDFYYSLHNAWAGGAFCFLTREIGERFPRDFRALLGDHALPLQRSAPQAAYCERFADGVYEMGTIRNLYDLLEKSTPAPQEVMPTGACSWEYLAEIKPEALSLVTELPYVKHPSDGSSRATAVSLRQLKLRIDADNKYVASVILEEWDRVAADLDVASPFYRKVLAGTVVPRANLHEGLPAWPQKTRDILLNPVYSVTATEGQRFNAWLFDRFYVLCHAYEFVRLLKASPQTERVRRAAGRLEAVFQVALADLGREVDFAAFEPIDVNALARVQLGAGLLAMNGLFNGRARPPCP